MKTDLNEKLIVVLVLISVAFLAFLAPHTRTWDGEAEVNVFPSPDAAKNYRLPAYVKVTEKKHGWFGGARTIQLDSAEWPNGGVLNPIGDCSISEHTKSVCDTNSGTFTIEVASYPEPPEEDHPIVE